jgi:hypothetical protein
MAKSGREDMTTLSSSSEMSLKDSRKILMAYGKNATTRLWRFLLLGISDYSMSGKSGIGIW